jgi:hypothetical protein
MDVDSKDGFRSYYIQKIEELQLIVNEKSQNLRRLQAQRNELNAKGKFTFNFNLKFDTHCFFFFIVYSSYVA